MDLVWRAGTLVWRPRRGWAVIAAEPCAKGWPCLGYVAILIAVALLVEFAAGLFAGAPLGAALATALSGYVQALVWLALLTFFARDLAPRFGGTGDLGRSLELAAYACTPVWFGGIFLLVPGGLGRLLALTASVYGLYLYFLGIPALMGVPAGRRRIGYFAVVLSLTLVLAMALDLTLAEVTGQAQMTIVHG